MHDSLWKYEYETEHEKLLKLEAKNKKLEKGYHLDKHTIKEYRVENKKLRDVLERVYAYEQVKDSKKKDRTIMKIIKEVLKDGE